MVLTAGVKLHIDYRRCYMKFLNYLFFKYYHFQVKVGNEDIAPYSALLCMCLIIMFIYVDILECFFFFIPSSKTYSIPSVNSVIILFVLSFVLLYFLLVHNHKYEKILEQYEERLRGKKNLGAILFATVPFLLFFAQLFISLKLP